MPVVENGPVTDGWQVPESLALPIRQAFAARAETGAPDGERWLSTVPDRLEQACDRWDLVPDGAPAFGACALVLPVRRAAGGLAVLRIVWPDPLGQEAADHIGLRAWAGQGAVRLLAASPADGIVLLERLGAPLAVAAPERVSEVLCELAVRLDRPPVQRTPRIDDLVTRALNSAETATARARLPRRFVSQAKALVEGLPDASGAVDRLVATRLDARHVLVRYDPAGLREGHGMGAVTAHADLMWACSRPRAAVGDPAYGAAPALYDLVGNEPGAIPDRLVTVSELTGISEERLRGWAIVRTVAEAVLLPTPGDFPLATGSATAAGASAKAADASRDAVAAAVIRLKALQPQ